MKILSYTGYRTGSRSFGEWLSFELNLPYHHEPFNPIFDIKNFSIENTGDCIIKIPPAYNIGYENLKKLFNKRIVLYRENTKEQAESIMWASERELWHHTYLDDKFISAHYSIPAEWLNKNVEEIETLTISLTEENKLLKSLTDCLHITYEELYYSDNGIKKIEDYIGFKSKSKFNNMHKLRNGVFKKSLT
jgi:hypothetical protein